VKRDVVYVKRDVVCVKRDVACVERGVYKETRTLSVYHHLFSAAETNMSKETYACEKKRRVHVKRDVFM